MPSSLDPILGIDGGDIEWTTNWPPAIPNVRPNALHNIPDRERLKKPGVGGVDRYAVDSARF